MDCSKIMIIISAAIILVKGHYMNKGADEGSVTIRVVDITVKQFQNQANKLKEAVAGYCNIYCTKKQGYCAKGNNISSNDVILVHILPEEGSDCVRVKLYVINPTTHNEAALKSHQLRNVIQKYSTNITSLFGNTVELLVDKDNSSMEPWRIATIAGTCTVAGLIIIIIIIMVCKKRKRVQDKAKQIEHEQRLSKYDSLRVKPGLANQLHRYEQVECELPSPNAADNPSYDVIQLEEELDKLPALSNGVSGHNQKAVKRSKSGLSRTPSKRLSDLSSVNAELESSLGSSALSSVLRRSMMKSSPPQSPIAEDGDIFMVHKEQSFVSGYTRISNGLVNNNEITLPNGNHKVSDKTNITVVPVVEDVHISNEDLATSM